MKNRYCNLFLFLLFIESSIGIIRNTLNLAGVDLSKMALLNIAEGSFSTIFMFLAIAEVIIAFKNKLKWPAKLIGLYPLFFTLVAMILGIGYLVTRRPYINSTNVSSFILGQSIYLLIVSLGQLSIGIWATKSLAAGHYEAAC